MKHPPLIAIALLAFLLAAPALASTLYSIDTEGQQLVTVDPVTGAVVVIGTGLGLPVGAFDTGTTVAMTFHDRRLYALRRGTAAKLYRIDIQTGVVVATTDFQAPAGTADYAEGLASFDGALLISFRSASISPAFTDAIGELDPETGTVAVHVTFGASDDHDFLVSDGAKLLGGVDTGLPGADSSDIYAIDLVTPTRTLLTSLPDADMPGNSLGWNAVENGFVAINGDSIFRLDDDFNITGSSTYDTVTYRLTGLASRRPGNDTDGDGIDDVIDNCIEQSNPDQYDSNGDDIGNLCDADFNGPGGAEDCVVNFLDLNSMKTAFFSGPASPTWNPDADLDNSGLINFTDLNILKTQFFGPPGPSASGCN